MRCGNGCSRTQHPCESLGEDWYRYGDWGIEFSEGEADDAPAEPAGAQS
jgi:hypothetical protein